MGEADERTRELDRLLDEVRARLGDWTDFNESDPGITFAEFFAFLAESLAKRADAIADEAYLAGGGGRRLPEVGVEIEGEAWRRVPTLEASGPDDPHYVVDQRDDGAAVIRFGDGEYGRRPPDNADFRVIYRRGSRFVSVELAQGRVAIDADAGDPAFDWGRQSEQDARSA